MSTFISHGYLTLSNHGGFQIELSNDGTYARLKHYEQVSHWQQIKFTSKGDSYVKYYGRKYKLSEFIKL